MHKTFCTGERDARHAGAVRRDNENRRSNEKPKKIQFSLRFGVGREKRFSVIYELLPTGKKNAIKPDVLCTRFGISARTLRKIILRERMEGHLIMSDSRAGGYFLADNEAEILEYIATQEAQAKTRLASSKAARDYLKRLKEQQSGQLTLNLQED